MIEISDHTLKAVLAAIRPKTEDRRALAGAANDVRGCLETTHTLVPNILVSIKFLTSRKCPERL